MANAFDPANFVAGLRQQEGVHLVITCWHDDFIVLEGVLTADGEGITPPFAVLVTITVQRPVQSKIPRLRAFDHWVRRDIDWHVFSDGGLCLDLPERWSDHVLAVADIHGDDRGSMYAVEYFLKAARWLLTRHFYGHRENIVQWPMTWPAWSHNLRGHREYARSCHAA